MREIEVELKDKPKYERDIKEKERDIFMMVQLSGPIEADCCESPVKVAQKKEFEKQFG